MMCPKCQSPMRTVDRQGIRLDQCTSCHGIFLDRGELEQILGAEQRHYGGIPAYGGEAYTDSPRPYRGGQHPDSPGPYRGGQHPDSPRPYRGGHHPDSPGPYGGRGRGRKRGFLEGLFD